MESTSSSSAHAALGLTKFADAVDLTRQTIWRLPDNLKPEGVWVGRRFLITEEPAAWLKRLKDAGGAPSRPKTPRDSEYAAGRDK